MKTLSPLLKICYLIGFLGIIASIFLAALSNKNYSWQIITLLWMIFSINSEIKYKIVKDKYDNLVNRSTRVR